MVETRLGEGYGLRSVRRGDVCCCGIPGTCWSPSLAQLKDTDGLILDLRDTPSGGDATVARPLMGRLVPAAFPYQRHERRGPGNSPRTWTEVVEPRGPFAYDRPMAVLVGRWTASMGEGVAIALDGGKRAAVFGSPMARLRGAIETHMLKHTKVPVRVPAERLYHVDGTSRELFVPPFPVEPGPGDTAFGTAFNWLVGVKTPMAEWERPRAR